MADDTSSLMRRLLTEAGIESGMRVLDVGCGGGEISLLVSEMVGETGQVVGIDKSAGPITAARQRAESLERSNASFVEADLCGPLPQLGTFDAVVGRRVLMYLPDLADVLGRIVEIVRPGGVLAFQESDSTMTPASLESMPLHDRVTGWIWQTVEREGANVHMGFELPKLLEEAGLVVESIRAEAVIQGQNTQPRLANIVRAMLPRMVRHGVATAKEVEIGTLEQRLRDERPDHAVYVSDSAFCVWARKPGPRVSE